tara:strand:+ start:1284 stop:1394 length:111 start_codon:yes stop_codon:yes gene_type:complete
MFKDKYKLCDLKEANLITDGFEQFYYPLSDLKSKNV